jgi:hypothetical protein
MKNLRGYMRMLADHVSRMLTWGGKIGHKLEQHFPEHELHLAC